MNWEKEASRILRAEVVRRGITYRELARRLQELKVIETERSIASKLSRGSFSFVFGLQCCRALGIKTLEVRMPAESESDGPSSEAEHE